MLQFLRPYEGIRHIWVDSVCINQRHATERGMQVPAMRSIYQNGLRTILYLGKDVVRNRTEFRNRRQFSDLVKGWSGVEERADKYKDSLSAVLKRRYFKRVWVIQELTLCVALIIPFADTDYLIGFREGARLIRHENPNTLNYSSGFLNEWESLSREYAPWLSSMCDGNPSLSLYQAVQKANRSQATDPRDKIFGILGLVDYSEPQYFDRYGRRQASGQAHLRVPIDPSYSITYTHATLGLSAYLLINMGELGVLKNARGGCGASEDPSAKILTPS